MSKINRDLLDEDGENRAVRSFLMLFQQRSITVLSMRNHMELSGWHGYWPDWVNDPANEGHLTKGGAQHWIRHLFSLEVAAKSEASTEPSALTACANCLRPKCEHNGKLCPAPYTTVWHAWDYKMQPMPTYKEYAAGALTDDAKDAARWRWIKMMHDGGDGQWFVYGASDNIEQEIDAAIEAHKTGSGKGEEK